MVMLVLIVAGTVIVIVFEFVTDIAILLIQIQIVMVAGKQPLNEYSCLFWLVES